MQEIDLLQLFNGLQAARKEAEKTARPQYVKLSDYTATPEKTEKPTAPQNSNNDSNNK